MRMAEGWSRTTSEQNKQQPSWTFFIGPPTPQQPKPTRCTGASAGAKRHCNAEGCGFRSAHTQSILVCIRKLQRRQRLR